MCDDSEFLRKALDLARSAVAHGNQPFGALVVHEGKIVTSAESTKITDQDCSHHAELLVATRAALFLDRQDLSASTLYTSTEPCAMCAGAVYWSGIGRVVFGCTNEDLIALSGDGLRISSREVLERGTRHVEVVGPMLREAAIKIHEEYWDHPREWWKGS